MRAKLAGGGGGSMSSSDGHGGSDDDDNGDNHQHHHPEEVVEEEEEEEDHGVAAADTKQSTKAPRRTARGGARQLCVTAREYEAARAGYVIRLVPRLVVWWQCDLQAGKLAG